MSRITTIDISALPAQRSAPRAEAPSWAPAVPWPDAAPPVLETRASRRAPTREPLGRRRSVQLVTTAALSLVVGAGAATAVLSGQVGDAQLEASAAAEAVVAAQALSATQLADAQAGATAAEEARLAADDAKAAMDADLTSALASVDELRAQLEVAEAAQARSKPTPSATPSASASATAKASTAPTASASASAPAQSAQVPQASPTTVPAATGTLYENCTAARGAGAAPVRTGDPGYGTHLDRDGDGVACE